MTIERIYELMRAKNMSQADIMRIGGIDKSTLSNILSGKRPNPSSRSLEKIAFALGTTLDFLRAKTHNPYPIAGDPIPDFGLDILETMRQLPRSLNYELLVIARSFLESRAQINVHVLEEFKQFLLDGGDDIAGNQFTDELLRRLDLLDDGDDSGSSDMLPPDNSDQPSNNDA